MKLYPIEREDFPRILTHEEVALIEKISRKSYIYSAIFVLLRTGLRSGELCSLDVSDIDLWNRKIIIRAKKAKGKRTRYVPIVDEVFVIIDNLMKEARENDREFLFANTAGKRQDGINLLRRFQMVLKQAQKEGMDISRVNIHTLRRTFISHMVMAGEDAIKIMAIVGHEDYQTMKKYLAFCGSYLASIPNLYNKEK